jgi:putative phosphoesterase
MLRIGVLSDTHLSICTETFRRQTAAVFSDCQVIIHAGDLTDPGILTAFKGKDVHVVHGNMCNAEAQRRFPQKKTIRVGEIAIGLCHGAGNRLDIEDRLIEMFPAADCIIFGHTHMPVRKTIGRTLLLNPGSFQRTARHGATGTYAILLVDGKGFTASIYELPADL